MFKSFYQCNCTYCVLIAHSSELKRHNLNKSIVNYWNSWMYQIEINQNTSLSLRWKIIQQTLISFYLNTFWKEALLNHITMYLMQTVVRLFMFQQNDLIRLNVRCQSTNTKILLLLLFKVQCPVPFFDSICIWNGNYSTFIHYNWFCWDTRIR